MSVIITHAIAFLLGAIGGAYGWSRYKSKAAADLATISKKIGP